MDAGHDLLSSGGRLAFRGAFDGVCDRYWWPAKHTNVRDHVDSIYPVSTAEPLIVHPVSL